VAVLTRRVARRAAKAEKAPAKVAPIAKTDAVTAALATLQH
jgi:hypothetical protein